MSLGSPLQRVKVLKWYRKTKAAIAAATVDCFWWWVSFQPTSRFPFSVSWNGVPFHCLYCTTKVSVCQVLFWKKFNFFQKNFLKNLCRNTWQMKPNVVQWKWVSQRGWKPVEKKIKNFSKKTRQILCFVLYLLQWKRETNSFTNTY